MTRQRRAVALGLLVALSLPLAAMAHPLGNFTINQYVAVHVSPDLVQVDYVVDRAEIPASQVLGGPDFVERENPSDAELQAFADTECESVIAGLRLELDGDPILLVTRLAVATAPEGAGGLATLRTQCLLQGDLSIDGAAVLSVSNENFADRIGWTEIVATAADVELETGLDVVSITNRLQSYPENRLESPPDIRTATIGVREDPGARRGERFVPGVGTGEPAQSTGDRFATLLDEADGGLGALTIALGVAFVLGAGHAAAPGHGKTVMAASLIGTRGRIRHATILGLSVALSHTAGVFILGVITFVASATFAPEAVFPYLAGLSGLIVTGIGFWLLAQWWRARAKARSGHHDHVHDHSHEEVHHHEPVVAAVGGRVAQHDTSEPHSHGFGTHTHAVIGDREITWKLLATLGLSGGLVPSVSAILLLLAAINIGRVGMGLVLILVFGLGMATTLVGVGIGAVFIGERGLARFGNTGVVARLQRYLAPLAGLVVAVIGIALTIRAMTDIF